MLKRALELLSRLLDRRPPATATANRVFFEDSPLPMLVYDPETHRLLDVNTAAVEHYGYTRDEFLSMTIRDIRPPGEVGALLAAVGNPDRPLRQHTGLFRHRKKSGEVIIVDIVSHEIRYLERRARLVVANDVTERHRTEEALRESEEHLRIVMDGVPALIGSIDRGGRYLYVNRAYETLLATPRSRIVGTTIAETFGEAAYAAAAPALARALTGERAEVEIEVAIPGRGARNLFVTYIPRLAGDRSVTGVVSLTSDITDRRRLEEQVRQSQKMDAVGQLAGGVAHDFNNLLTVISATTELTLEDPALSGEAREDLLEVRRATTRATDLTRQLLALGRKQTLQPRATDVNETIAQSEKMLRRLVRADVVLETRFATSLGAVFADPLQLEIALLNLVVNARDAMPEGGRVAISTREVLADEALAREVPGVAPGAYVAISVTDSGTGMTREVLERAFEPFFTTKQPGKGTGLGLATVYGIAKQSGGAIHLASAPGAGTTATLYLPRIGDPVSAPGEAAPEPPARGSETVLVVEDEPGVRAVAERVLAAAGYDVLSTRSGEEALALLRARGGKVDLIVSDVVMPGMGGPALATRALAEWPSVRVLLTSGYAADELGPRRVPLGPLLQKPFTPQTLARAVRAALDERRG